MLKIPLRGFLWLCPLFMAMPAHALDLKFTTPNEVTRCLEPIVGPTTLSVVNEEGGLLRFRSQDKLRYCQMGVAPNGTALKQADGEIAVTFRFGAEKQSFGLYLQVAGDDPAYLALVSIWTGGQGSLRLFKVPPKTQVEDQHQIAKENVRSPLTPGSWYTLTVRTATQSGQAVQLTAELAPATRAAVTTATAVDPNGLRDPGMVNIRFYTGDADQSIDVRQITVPASGTPPARSSTPAAKPPGR